ncbi:DUF4123 domain-containing protein [Pseudomonas sp. IC_126]|uniref:DUF4123 domain-containing protein n=1 Tax=Pseudomonas sp. IC_126 TaxID=2547400 RepID=UPI00103C6541|nr:DUF4123 domain-containing protein [Pseudomonas sp. IC_126]TCD22484.1 DUF4123 domain-containing protein [Pseudomonas sp. IC_126]
MNDQVRQWLDEQQAQQRQLLLIIDSLAEPSPIQELFVSDLMQDYINLYHGTEFADLADIGPWLVAVSASEVAQIQPMLDAPERNWGWLASADRIDLTALAQHWRERMQVDEKGQRSLYRFQDSRVIARHLAELAPAQQPLLLGPLNSALCWDGECWQCFDNARPGQYPAPFEAAWLTLPEPDTVVREIQRHNLTLWLWQNHSAATARLAETRVLSDWLDEQLDKAERWQWKPLEYLQFLLRYQLDPEFAENPAWKPEARESPESHFVRLSQLLNAASTAREQQS